MDEYGKLYGWAINLFERAVHWVPALKSIFALSVSIV